MSKSESSSARCSGQEWMLEFQRGDDEAFDRIVRHYSREVRRFIGRYLTDADRAEDIAQEAFIRVYRSRARYQPTAKFRTWLYTIVTRLCLNEIRSVKRERSALPIQRRAGGGEGFEDPVDAVADSQLETPAARVECEELESVLRGAIDSLPANQRAAILLLRFHDASYREIGEVLDLSVMAVKSLVNRARETLRSRLARYRAGNQVAPGPE